MRMDPQSGVSAADWLAGADEQEIADVLWQFGEERFSRRIARVLVETRQAAPITRTSELADLVTRTIGRREPGKHPATRTFQALRIVVNGELEQLAFGLQGALTRLNTGGRLAVISFHSLEDRVVKRFIRGHAQAQVVRRGLPPPPGRELKLRALGAARMPAAAEIAANPRSRSAVLRVAERLP